MLRLFLLSCFVALAAAQTCSLVDNCDSCNNPDLTCRSCRAGFGLQRDPTDGCLACPSNCIDCIPDGDTGINMRCIRCQAGFVLDTVDGTCVACVTGCETCTLQPDRQTTICTECFFRFALQTTLFTCHSCPSNCDVCRVNSDGITTSCTTCSDDFVLNNSEATPDCLRCPERCNSCSGNPLASSSSQSRCTSSGCDPEFYFDSETEDCLICQVGNCVNCGSEGDTCSACAERFRLIDDNLCDPCPGNCLQCEEDADGVEFCTVCATSFTLAIDTGVCQDCESNCLACTSSDTCIACDDDFVVSNGDCLRCPTNCQDGLCSSSNNVAVCSGCLAGFGLVLADPDADSTSTSCSPCAMPGCGVCTGNSANNNCEQCAAGFRPDAVDTIAACQSCTAQRCTACADAVETCTACSDGFAVAAAADDNDLTNCDPCEDSNCLTCTSPNVCTACREGFGTTPELDADGNPTDIIICRPCTANNCVSCNTDAEVCNACPAGAWTTEDETRDVDGTATTFTHCVACRASGCLTCNNPEICLTCNGGAGPDPATGNCRRCATTNCNLCAGNYETCTACNAGFVLDNNQCFPCSDNCATCTYNSQTSSTVCQTCDGGFGLLNGNCQACPRDCGACSANVDGVIECDTCEEEFWLDDDTDCTVCPPNCNTCAIQNDAVFCTMCDERFALNNDGRCERCPSSCETCSVSTDSVICSVCDIGFALSADRSACIGCSTATTISNCALCTNVDALGNSNCTACDGGFTFRNDDAQDFCTPCSDLTDCATCRDQFFICDEDRCSGDYQRDEEGDCVHFCYICGDGEEYLADGTCGLSVENGGNYTSVPCPGGYCWVDRLKAADGTLTSRRGCRTDFCTEDAQGVACFEENGVETCSQCCEGNLCNDYESSASTVTVALALLATSLMAVLVAMC